MLQQDLKKRDFALYLIVFYFICSSHSNVMYCTEEHNIILCRDVLFKNLYKYKKGSPQWSETWRKIADILSKCAIPCLMHVDHRAIWDQINVLVNKHKEKD